jgi:hypothetical protein
MSSSPPVNDDDVSGGLEADARPQVEVGVVPVEPGDPGQRLAGRGREAFLLVLSAAGGVQDDCGGVVQSLGEFQQSRWLASASRLM